METKSRHFRSMIAVMGIALLVLIGAANAALAQTYTITNLGTLGGNSSQAHDVNNLAQVVGQSTKAGGDLRAFLWDAGVMTDLGTIDGEGNSSAQAINNLTQVVGTSENEDFPTVVGHAFLWQAGVMTDLGTLGGNNSSAADINDFGQIVGQADTAPDPDLVSFTHAFLYQGGVMYDLGTLGGNTSSAAAVNVRGQVAGSSANGLGQVHAFLWTPNTPNGTTGTMIDLGTLGGSSSVLRGINDAGQVVGISLTASGAGHAFLWTPDTPNGTTGTMIDLGTLGGTSSDGLDINNAGQVVGVESLQKAFLWQNFTGMVDLDTVLPPDSVFDTLEVAFGINAQGNIVGRGKVDGDNRAYLLVKATAEMEKVAFKFTLDLPEVGEVVKSGEFLKVFKPGPAPGPITTPSFTPFFNEGLVQLQVITGGAPGTEADRLSFNSATHVEFIDGAASYEVTARLNLPPVKGDGGPAKNFEGPATITVNANGDLTSVKFKLLPKK